MELITEDKIKEILQKVLNEDTQKASRMDYNRVQFKIDEIVSSLTETQKELRKLRESIPGPLKKVTDKKLNEVTASLSNSQRIINDMRIKIQQIKKSNSNLDLSELITSDGIAENERDLFQDNYSYNDLVDKIGFDNYSFMINQIKHILSKLFKLIKYKCIFNNYDNNF